MTKSLSTMSSRASNTCVESALESRRSKMEGKSKKQALFPKPVGRQPKTSLPFTKVRIMLFHKLDAITFSIDFFLMRMTKSSITLDLASFEHTV